MRFLGFGRQGPSDIRDLTPEAAHAAFAAGEAVLVDVREPNEWAMAHIEGSQLLPLSRFDPHAIEKREDQEVIYLCAGGIRSVTAIEIARAAGLKADAHLAGGLKAWHAAGLPLVRGE